MTEGQSTSGRRRRQGVIPLPRFGRHRCAVRFPPEHGRRRHRGRGWSRSGATRRRPRQRPEVGGHKAEDPAGLVGRG